MWAILAAGVGGGLIGESVRRLVGRLAYRRADAPQLDPGRVGATRLEADPASVPGGCGTPSPPAWSSPPTGVTGSRVGPMVGVGAEATGPGLDERDLPSPGSRWWMTAACTLAWAGVAWRAGADWRMYLLWLPFATIGLYLAAVDLDVHRLPDRAQAGLAVAGLVAGLVVWWAEPRRWLAALGVTVAVGLLFWLIHLIGRGALGFGDVKLVATCGWLLGLIGLTAVWVGLVLACALAVAAAAIRRTKTVAFGPWLVVGTLLAGLWAGSSV